MPTYTTLTSFSDGTSTVAGTGGGSDVDVTVSGSQGFETFDVNGVNGWAIGESSFPDEEISLSFSRAVSSAQFTVTALNENEAFSLTVNGIEYTITASDITATSGGGTFAIAGGDLIMTTFASDGVAVLTISPPGGITSLSMKESNSVGTILVASVAIDTDPYAAVCFAAGTLIATETGDVAVEDLCAGDRILVAKGAYKPLKWLAHVTIEGVPHLCPIRFRKGSLGPDTPARDLLVSPQHRIALNSAIAKRMFGNKEILVAAKKLTQLDGVAQDFSRSSVAYYHLLFDRHEIVFANGAPCESLHLGAETMKTLSPAAIQELRELFPGLLESQDSGELCRLPVKDSARLRNFMKRSVKNAKPLIEAVA